MSYRKKLFRLADEKDAQVETTYGKNHRLEEIEVFAPYNKFFNQEVTSYLTIRQERSDNAYRMWKSAYDDLKNAKITEYSNPEWQMDTDDEPYTCPICGNVVELLIADGWGELGRNIRPFIKGERCPDGCFCRIDDDIELEGVPQ